MLKKLFPRSSVASTLSLLVVVLTGLSIGTGVIPVAVKPALACEEKTQNKFTSGNFYFHLSLRCPWKWGDKRTRDLGKFNGTIPEGARYVSEEEDEYGSYTLFYLEKHMLKINDQEQEFSGWFRIQH